ncbi:helix-turn-helix domain-containing protein [Butyricimonas sp.]|uniref:helix-turn-helix domain-containing protein n=1 Tax=Butyricimonas sp. TaxID=1969738 RepID=UPI0025C423CA|nr:helix-turn-helix domain-containing protein [Butyricimonas sp.]
MYFDEQSMAKAFEKCFDYFERLENRLDALEKREYGIDGERLLDSQDLCELLKVTKRTIERYRREKRLPFLKIKGKVFFKFSDIQSCMKRIESKKFDD